MGVITDPIADLLVRINNANQRKHKSVSIPHSRIKESVVKILETEGYIESFELKKVDDVKKNIVVNLKYKGTQRVITGMKRISKPGLRVYTSATDIPKVLSGFGVAIVSTSQGIITGKEAKKAQIGGEVLAYVW